MRLETEDADVRADEQLVNAASSINIPTSRSAEVISAENRSCNGAARTPRR